MFFALALFVSVLAGCSNSSNPTAQMQDESAITAPVTNVSLLQLPGRSAATSLLKKTSAVLVNPGNGGDVNVSDTFITASGGTGTIDMTLHFEPGTVNNATMVSISLQGTTLTAEFSPSGAQFSKPAFLSASVTGLDFSLVPADANFGLYYINGSTYEKMIGTVVVDRGAGTLTLTDGQITHFSLYGFGFTK